MQTTTFSELRNHAKKYFDEVEKGETIQILRHGKPVAMLIPVRSGANFRWKRIKPLQINGISLSKAILDERREP